MNILLLLAHAIEEYDQVKLLSGLGYDVFSLGGYIDPAHPHDPKRPPLPEAPFHAEFKAIVDALGTDNNLETARCHIPEPILDWADTVIVHHSERTWLGGQWDRLRRFLREGGRVIWRTVGQSATVNEEEMAPLRAEGLEIVRYSPKERNLPGFAGEDALIRFYKDPQEWSGWTGEEARVINISAHLYQRGEATNWRFWEEATAGLPRLAAGPGSEDMGGPGELSLADMMDQLRRARAYLYTGTQPASYTLGLIEALMTGVPVVSIGPEWFTWFPYGPELFEGHELAELSSDEPEVARAHLSGLLSDHDFARRLSRPQRQRAIQTFGRDRIAAQWRQYLG